MDVDASGYLERPPKPPMSKNMKKKIRKYGAMYEVINNPPPVESQLKKRLHKETLQGVESDAGQSPDIVHWLGYNCGSLLEAEQDYTSYIRRGTTLLRHQISVLCHNPRKYCEQAQGAEYMQQLSDGVLAKEDWLCTCLATEYLDVRMHDLKKTNENTGYSYGAMTFLLLCFLTMFRNILDCLCHVYINNPSVIPNLPYPTCSFVSLHNQGNFKHLIPPLLQKSINDFPGLAARGLVLYGGYIASPIGAWTQRQTWFQLNKIANEWSDVSMGDMELFSFLECLRLRIAELMCFPKTRALQWYHGDADHPLDMVDRYQLPKRFNGVSPNDKGAQLDFNELFGDPRGGKKTKSMKEKMKWRSEEPMVPSRSFLVECTGVFAPIFRAMYVYKTDVFEHLMEPHELNAYENKLAMKILDGTSWEHVIDESSDVFGAMVEGLRNWMRSKRNDIRDDKYKKELIRDHIRQTLPFGLRERYAFAAGNHFRMAKKPEELEDYEIPRPVLDRSRVVCKTLAIGQFEMPPFKARARHYATLKLMQKLMYEYDKQFHWLDLVVFDAREFGAARSRTDMPLILLLAGETYLCADGHRVARMPDAHHTIMLWILQIVVVHGCVMNPIGSYTKKVPFWNIVLRNILKATPFAEDLSSDCSDSDDSDEEPEVQGMVVDDAGEQEQEQEDPDDWNTDDASNEDSDEVRGAQTEHPQPLHGSAPHVFTVEQANNAELIIPQGVQLDPPRNNTVMQDGW